MPTKADFENVPVNSGVILTKNIEASAFQKASQQIALPGNGTIVHTFDSGEAAYVTEGGRKPLITTASSSLRVMAYKFAKVVTITNELSADNPAIADAIYKTIPNSFGSTFDKVVSGELATPGSDFSNLSTAISVEVATVADLHDAIAAVEATGVSADAIVMSSAFYHGLRAAVNALGTRVFDFTDGLVEGVPYFVYRSASRVAFVGPFSSRSVFGVVDGEPSARVSTEATLVADNGDVISLWQNNLIGVLGETRVGFRVAAVSEYRKLTLPAVV